MPVRKYTPPTENETRLADQLDALITDLATHWYKLPAKSTRRHVNGARRDLALGLAPVSSSASSLVSGELMPAIAKIAHFVQDISSLNGVAAVAPQSLPALQDTLAQLDSVDTTISADELAALRELLEANDPFVVAIGRMHYVPATALSTFVAVRMRIEEGKARLPADVQQQIDEIAVRLEPALDAADHFEQTMVAYTSALTELEQISAVARIAHSIFLENKVSHSDNHLVTRSVKTQPSSSFESLSSGELAPVQSISELTGDAALSLETTAETVEFQTDVRFPDRVKLGEEVPLILQLTVEQHAESIVSDAPVMVAFEREIEHVEVVLLAPNFAERTDVWSRTIMVHRNQNSEPAIFLLKGEALGKQRLTLDLRHHGRHIGQIVIDTTISTQQTSFMTTPRIEQLDAIRELSKPTSDPVDLELRISTSGDGKTLHFMLHSSKAAVGYHWRPVGSITLTADDPQQYLEAKFERMSRLAYEVQESTPAEKLAEIMDELSTIGQGFFEDLFPPVLKEHYWKRIKPLREKNVLHSFLITSDEPWIPWEMVRPYRYDEFADEEETDGFLAETFQFCRWLAGHGPADGVAVKRIEMIIPVLDLAFVDEEKARLENLAASKGMDIGAPIQLRGDALKRIREGGFEVLHFAAHALFDPQQPERSALTMEDGELVPEDLNGERIKGLRKSKPIVFLNACHTSRMNFGLIGLGGWAEKLVQDGRVSAFIGTLWEVNDKLALAFATKFYDGLEAGQTLGEAFSNARLHARDASPANPTWLAYTLYGDPNGLVEF